MEPRLPYKTVGPGCLAASNNVLYELTLLRRRAVRGEVIASTILGYGWLMDGMSSQLEYRNGPVLHVL